MVRGLVALAVAVAVPVGAQGPASRWIISEKHSQLDGSSSYSALLESEAPLANIINNDEKAVLGVDCDKRGFYASVTWPDFIQKNAFSDTDATVSWKLDDAPVQQTKFFATDQAVARKGKAGIEWFKRLATGHRLVVSIPDRHGGQEAVFNLAGIENVDAKLRTLSC